MNKKVGTGMREADVNIQDQTTPPFKYFLMTEEKTDIVLTETAEEDTNILNVLADHGITSDHWLSIWQDSSVQQVKVKSVDANEITIDRKLATDCLVATTKIVRGVVDMNVNGSSTPVTFKLKMYNAIIPVDITQARLNIVCGSEPDDALFGDLAELTNGLSSWFVNSRRYSLGVYRTNASFRENGGDLEYTSKGGGGNYSVNIIFRFGGQPHFGVVLRVNPRIPDTIETIVQDNLSDLVRFRISMIGHYTESE